MTPVVPTVDRSIACEAVFNLRDLGGYTTSTGERVRWRVLFRADGLHRIPADAVASLAELGWRTVLDLRTLGEIDGGRFACDGVEAVHLPILRETWDAAVLADEVADVVAFLAARYLEMTDSGGAAIAGAFELLAAPSRLPAVFHCSAGKDRTGVLAALLLAALGVDDEQIAADYHLSAQAMDPLVDWITASHPGAAEVMARQPQAFLSCPPEAILRFLDGLRERHGSTGAYLRSIGIGDGTIASLRQGLLEPS